MKILRKTMFILMLSQAILFADEVYNAQKGDTLYSISRNFQITVAELRTANNLSESDVLKAGQRLVIPSADIGTAAALSSAQSNSNSVKSSNSKTSEYVVQPGDTLYRISKNNNMTVAELLSLNNLDSSVVIKVGQKLKVGGSANAQSSPSLPVPSKENTPIILDDSKSTAVSIAKMDSNSSVSNIAVKIDSKNASTAGTKSSASSDSLNGKLVDGIVDTDKTPDTRTYGVTKNADDSTSWPVKNPKITYIKGKAAGVQLGCDENEKVTAVRAGTVMYVGLYRGYGQVLFIQSKTGLIYAYTGLGNVKVKKGDYVVFGDEIGTAGKDAINGAPQITFMVFQNGSAIDPAKAARG